ncbi:MAG: hypothetical protein KAI53_01505 [Candidatus Aenigmarchaeota archaeon]|nr:hypothetical protein [Candidatus Aenigmarchaeota archaeon]
MDYFRSAVENYLENGIMDTSLVGVFKFDLDDTQQDIILHAIAERIENKDFSYDEIKPVSVDSLMSCPGFKVQINSLAYVFENYPEELSFDVDYVKENMQKKGYSVFSPREIVKYYWRMRAEDSPLELERLGYGLKVVGNMAEGIKNIEGIRVIGAESRLSGRDAERGITDLDLEVDFFEGLPYGVDSLYNTIDVLYCMTVASDAEEKTGIPVDVLGEGFPITEGSAEHATFRFDWSPYRGFPVYWKNNSYLYHIALIKQRYNDSVARENQKTRRLLEEQGLM